MSYSLSFRAASIAALCAAAASKFDAEVVAQQPAHMVDRAAALANLKTHAELAGEPPERKELSASMHGSVWAEVDPSTGAVTRLMSVGGGCSVSIADKAVG